MRQQTGCFCRPHSGKAGQIFCNCLLYTKQFRDEMEQAYAAQKVETEVALAA